jgi:hypothetical protein
MYLNKYHPRIDGISLLCALALLGAAGCSSPSGVRTAERALNRALAIEPTSAFFQPVINRAKDLPPPPEMSARARQHYLDVVADIERRGAEAKESLRREGVLGDALILKALAQWRLGRLPEAQNSIREARSTGQEALDARDRALAAAFEGVVRLHNALNVVAEGQSFREIFELIAGPGGAWRQLRSARVEARRVGATMPELLETRLAAFKVANDARSRASQLDQTTVPYDSWSRLRADAQVELNELAALRGIEGFDAQAKAREWQLLCGLDELSR